ncbi:Conserved_hypothetical protein [Hexamita inflata]|uniref:Uncharacterized protein n=1 Tax=Hexamita inflata TaxID=28002 RepID=A0AA86PT28_9EUKA|nr:Conserved hypothetical protein [Hexamita inflata]
MSDDEQYSYDDSNDYYPDQHTKDFILMCPEELDETALVIINNVVCDHNLNKLQIQTIQDIDLHQYSKIYGDFLSLYRFQQHYQLNFRINENQKYFKNSTLSISKHYFLIQNYQVELIPIEQFFQIQNVCFIYEFGIVLKMTDKFHFYDFDKLKDVLHSSEFEADELADQIQEHYLGYNTYVIFKSYDQNSFYKKYIKPTTHWLKNEKNIILDGTLFENKLCLPKKLETIADQIETNEAMFLTYIDNNYYFYSRNVCYKTNASFEIIEKRDIDFPYCLYKDFGEFRSFSNDYIMWFETAECDGKHYSNVCDTMYEFGVFTVKKLATIPDYPVGLKNYHKVVSADGLIFVTNGQDVFKFSPFDLSFNQISQFNTRELKLHKLNGYIVCRASCSQEMFLFDLEFNKCNTLKFNNEQKDIILNNKYFVNYGSKFQITNVIDSVINIEKTNIEPRANDIVLANYILIDGQWDLTDASFKKFLGATKQQLILEEEKYKINNITCIAQIFSEYIKQNAINQQLANQIICKLQMFGIQKLSKIEKSNYLQLLLATQQYHSAMELLEQFRIQISFQQYFLLFSHVKEQQKIVKLIKYLNEEEQKQAFELLENQSNVNLDLLIELLINEKTILKYIQYKIEQNADSGLQFEKIMQEMSNQDKQTLLDTAINKNNLNYAKMLTHNLQLAVNTNISSQMASLLLPNYPDMINDLVEASLIYDLNPLYFKKIKAETSGADYLYLSKNNIDSKCYEKSFAVFQAMISQNKYVNSKQLPAHMKKQIQFNKNLTNQFGVNFESGVQFTDIFGRTNKDFKTLNEQMHKEFEGSEESYEENYEDEDENEEESEEESFVENDDLEEEF